MKNIKPVFKIYNPNTEEKTAEIFLAILVSANTERIETEILHTAAAKHSTRAKAQARTASV